MHSFGHKKKRKEIPVAGSVTGIYLASLPACGSINLPAMKFIKRFVIIDIPNAKISEALYLCIHAYVYARAADLTAGFFKKRSKFRTQIQSRLGTMGWNDAQSKGFFTEG